MSYAARDISSVGKGCSPSIATPSTPGWNQVSIVGRKSVVIPWLESTSGRSIAALRAVRRLVVGLRPARFVVESRLGTSGWSSRGGISSQVSVRGGSTGVFAGSLGGIVSVVCLLVAAALNPVLARR